ncbi:MAG: hypothetical protein ABH824_05255 [Nanoarchaeota archaeon]|nr:hypothetical protein [Nanoarchaeota archaeon]MBU1632808.1 hypothetical protein [Nanoarchaeota archaeon]MBU1876499.1 hypothetical protein [Nanoarchaeota archaeon]
MERKKKIMPCKCLCRDGTACLNKGKHEGYCWVHKKRVEFVKLQTRLGNYPEHNIARRWLEDIPLERRLSG